VTDPRLLGATARAAAEKVAREYPQALMVPGTVIKTMQQTGFGELSALVHVDGDPAGDLRQVDIIDGREYVSGTRVMVEFVPPHGAVIRGALDRSSNGLPPCGWADCTDAGEDGGIVPIPDYMMLSSSEFTPVPMDTWTSSPGFAAYFEQHQYGWEAIRACSIEVDYTTAWDTQSAEEGSYQTALLVSSQDGSVCSELPFAYSYACGDQHMWSAADAASDRLAALSAWYHDSSTMLSVEPGDVVALGARWFSEAASGNDQYLITGTVCTRDLTARLAVHILEPNAPETPFDFGGEN
jgi:hypothetical protein